jgi:hypothetical protein
MKLSLVFAGFLVLGSVTTGCAVASAEPMGLTAGEALGAQDARTMGLDQTFPAAGIAAQADNPAFDRATANVSSTHRLIADRLAEIETRPTPIGGSVEGPVPVPPVYERTFAW